MMSKKTIVIRCITEPSKGFGHLSRCLTIAKELKKLGNNPIFLINSNKSAISKISKSKFTFKIIPMSVNYENDSQIIEKNLSLFNSTTILIDMREFSEKISKELINKNFYTIILDDAWVKKAYANIIINGTIIKKYHKYSKINNNSKLFLGSKYWIANKLFRKNKKKISEIKDKQKYCVLISMGGGDPDQLTQIVLESILDINNISIRIILGPFYKNKDKIYKEIRTNKNISVCSDSSNIWKEFKKSDIVISNGGSTLFELAIQGIPTIAIVASSHQKLYTEFFSSKGFCIDLGPWKKISKKNIQKNLNQLLKNKTKRQKMCRIGHKIIDGNGLSRVSKIIDKIIEENNIV